MAVTETPGGLYRAYKKIGGHTHQTYHKERAEADHQQKALDAMAALKPRKLFSDDGMPIGLGVAVKRRGDRPAYAYARIQIQRNHGRLTREIRYRGNFEDFWRSAWLWWCHMQGLDPVDRAGYAKQKLTARRAVRDRIDALRISK